MSGIFCICGLQISDYVNLFVGYIEAQAVERIQILFSFSMPAADCWLEKSFTQSESIA